MKRFIKAFIPFILMLIACDVIIGSLLEYNYKRITQGFYYETTFAIEGTTAPYVVVGSSRASHHYQSNLFSQILGRPFYNCGRDAQELIYSAAVLSAVLDRYTPKLVIIDMLPNEFTTTEAGKLGALLPYYNNKSIRPFLAYNSKFEAIKQLSGMYRYNSQMGNIIAGRILKKTVNTDQKGYLPMFGRLPDVSPELMDQERGKAVDAAKFKVFSALLLRLERRKIRTLVVISPLYKKYTKGQTVKVCEQLVAGKKYVRFLNFTNKASYRDPKLFYNDYHLNDTGAAKFSKELAYQIRLLD